MNIVRSKYDSIQKHYMQNLYQQHGKIPDNHMQAINLRMNFFRTWVLEKV